MNPIRRFINRFRPSKIIRKEIDAAMNRWLRDIDFALRLQAILDSAKFVSDNIPLHRRFDPCSLRKMAIDRAPQQGLLLEFGVWKAGWINQMAQWTDRRFYGFDSFEGLPEPWSTVDKGFFAIDGLPKVRENVSLIKGWFHETLPPFLEQNPGPVAFVHVDCDLYSSTKTVLELLRDRFVPGTVLVLDDFLMEPGWQDAEHQAFLDFVAAHKINFEYLGYQTGMACAVAVQLTGNAPAPISAPHANAFSTLAK